MIEDLHVKQFKFIEKHDLKLGSKIELDNGEITEITFINRFYGWFGNKEREIKIEEIKKVLPK